MLERLLSNLICLNLKVICRESDYINYKDELKTKESRTKQILIYGAMLSVGIGGGILIGKPIWKSKNKEEGSQESNKTKEEIKAKDKEIQELREVKTRQGNTIQNLNQQNQKLHQMNIELTKGKNSNAVSNDSNPINQPISEKTPEEEYQEALNRYQEVQAIDSKISDIEKQISALDTSIEEKKKRYELLKEIAEYNQKRFSYISNSFYEHIKSLPDFQIEERISKYRQMQLSIDEEYIEDCRKSMKEINNLLPSFQLVQEYIQKPVITELDKHIYYTALDLRNAIVNHYFYIITNNNPLDLTDNEGLPGRLKWNLIKCKCFFALNPLEEFNKFIDTLQTELKEKKKDKLKGYDKSHLSALDDLKSIINILDLNKYPAFTYLEDLFEQIWGFYIYIQTGVPMGAPGIPRNF